MANLIFPELIQWIIVKLFIVLFILLAVNIHILKCRNVNMFHSGVWHLTPLRVSCNEKYMLHFNFLKSENILNSGTLHNTVVHTKDCIATFHIWPMMELRLREGRSLTNVRSPLYWRVRTGSPLLRVQLRHDPLTMATKYRCFLQGEDGRERRFFYHSH